MKCAMVTAGFAVVIAGILLAQADQALNAPDRDAVQYAQKKAAKNDIEIVVKVRGENVAGDGVNVDISLTNRGAQEVGYIHADFYHDFRFEVLTHDGEKVPYTRLGQALFENSDVRKVGESKLPPGKSHSICYNIGLLFDLSMPGKYRLGVKKGIGGTKTESFGLEVSELEFRVSPPRFEYTEKPIRKNETPQ